MPTKWSFALSACPCFTFTHARLYTRRVNSYLRSNKLKTKLKTHPVKNHVIVPIYHFVQTIVKFVCLVAAPVTLLLPRGNKAGKILFSSRAVGLKHPVRFVTWSIWLDGECENRLSVNFISEFNWHGAYFQASPHVTVRSSAPQGLPTASSLAISSTHGSHPITTLIK